jgi:hypothetical protein
MDGSAHLNGKVNERINEYIDLCLDGSVGGWLDWLSSAALLCCLDPLTLSRALSVTVTSNLRDTFSFLCVYRSFAMISSLLHVREMFVDVIMFSAFVSSVGCSDCFCFFGIPLHKTVAILKSQVKISSRFGKT